MDVYTKDERVREALAEVASDDSSPAADVDDLLWVYYRCVDGDSVHDSHKSVMLSLKPLVLIFTREV